MDKLMLRPMQAGFTVQLPEDDVKRAKLSGGPSQFALDVLGGPSTVNVLLNVNAAEKRYFFAFRRTTITEGVVPFLWDLEIDDGEKHEYVCTIIPGSVSVGEPKGGNWPIALQVEAQAISYDADYDTAYVTSFEAAGGDVKLCMDLLAKTVNETLP